MMPKITNICAVTGVHKNYCDCPKHLKQSRPYKEKLLEVNEGQVDPLICKGCKKQMQIFHDGYCKKCYYRSLFKKTFGRYQDE